MVDIQSTHIITDHQFSNTYDKETEE